MDKSKMQPESLMMTFGYNPEWSEGSVKTPIFQTSTFVFRSAQEGKDFFDWNEPVDWIIGNPPYSIMNQWLTHSLKLADNIVYLIPIAKLFGSKARLKQVRDFGIREIWSPWTGRAIGFEFGWACGCVHLQRGYHGGVNIDYK
jgi:hypothetical protein